MLKFFVGESFTVASISVTEKGWIRRGGSFKLFRRKIYVSVPRIFVGESFTVALISGIEKVWIGRGGVEVSRFSIENFLSHSGKKSRRGILYCCSIFR